MAIILADGFIIDTPGAIDSRFKVQTKAELDTLQNRYYGLKTYVVAEDLTYVWVSTNEWKIDSGGSINNNNNNGTNINNNWTTNIYGSGSVIRDTELFLGTVSNALNDRSFYHNIWSQGKTDKDENRILNYFYRTADGQDYDTMGFKMEQQLKPFGLSPQRGAYIEFNSGLTYSVFTQSDAFKIGLRNLVFGTGEYNVYDPTNTLPPNQKVISRPKLSIDYEYVNFHLQSPRQVGGQTQELGLPNLRIFSQPKFDSYDAYDDVIFGMNVSLNDSSDANKKFIESVAAPGYRFRFGYQGLPSTTPQPTERIGEKNFWNFEIRPGYETNPNSQVWTSAIQIYNKRQIDNSFPDNSPVKLLIDTSFIGYSAVQGIGSPPLGTPVNVPTVKTWGLTTPLDIIRKIPHRFEKMQMWNKGTCIIVNNASVQNSLYLTDDGNSFDIDLPANQRILTIRHSSGTSYPIGTIVYIKFRNVDPLNPGYLQLQRLGDTLAVGVQRDYIASDVSDSTFFGTDNTRLTIFHEDNNISGGSFQYGDTIVFRREVDNWTIINVNRQHRITKRAWLVDQTSLPAGSQALWNFAVGGAVGKIGLLSATSSTGVWNALNFTTFQNTGVGNGYAPGIWDFERPSVLRTTSNPNNFKFRFSVDGNRLVYCQGNFRIVSTDSEVLRSSGRTGTKFFFKSENRVNILTVGFVFQNTTTLSLLPNLESNWTYVKMYGTAKSDARSSRVEIIFTDSIMSINSSGQIMLEFYAEPVNTTLNTAMVGLEIDVWVPPFSYQAVDLPRTHRNL